MSRNAFEQCAREIEEREYQRQIARAERLAVEGHADILLKVVPQYTTREPKQFLDIVGPSRNPDYYNTKIAEAMYDSENLGYYVASLEEAEANARRLVACWNACAGISTAELERIALFCERMRVKATDERTEDEDMGGIIDFDLEPQDNPKATAADHASDTLRDDELTGDR